jgi:hypothetical protein
MGFSISRREEEFPIMSFRDIGAVFYYLKAIPWQVSDFDVSRYRRELLRLHEHIEVNGSFDVATHRFVLQAHLDKSGTTGSLLSGWPLT